MTGFRLFFTGIFVIITAYTLIVGAHYGYDLLPIFLAQIGEMTWPGQFNVDFTCFLAMSALWVAWRHQFSAAGLALGVAAFLLGSLFLSIYLLVQSYRIKGDMPALLMGQARAGAVRR